jgi:hypothetical protein
MSSSGKVLDQNHIKQGLLKNLNTSQSKSFKEINLLLQNINSCIDKIQECSYIISQNKISNIEATKVLNNSI